MTGNNITHWLWRLTSANTLAHHSKLTITEVDVASRRETALHIGKSNRAVLLSNHKQKLQLTL